MKQIPLIVWYAGSERESRAIAAMLTQVRILARFMTGANNEKLVDAQFVDIEDPDFKLDTDRLTADKAVVVLLFTPAFVLNEKVTGEAMEKLIAARHGARVVPIYCKPVPVSAVLPWSSLLWAGQLHPSKVSPKALSDYGRAFDEQVVTVSEILAQTVRAQLTPPVEPPCAIEPTMAATRSRTAANPVAANVRRYSRVESKAPALAIFCEAADRAAVQSGLGDTLRALTRTRNLRYFADWNITAGSNRHLQVSLAAIAPVLLFCLSADSLASDEFYSRITAVAASQKVVFVVVSACMWEYLATASTMVLPKKHGMVKPVIGSGSNAADAWKQVGQQLMALFPKRLPEENESQLTLAEQAIREAYQAESRRQEQRHARLPVLEGAALAKAYYDK